MFRLLVRGILGFLICFVVLLVPAGDFTPLAGVGTAHAQDNGRPKTLFDLLFKEKKKEAAPVKRKVIRKKATKKKVVKPRVTKKKAKTVRKTAPARAAVATAAAEPPQIAEKSENARQVLVVGDFIADGMAGELKNMFAETPSVIVEREISGSSGFVRDDFFNWPQEITGIIEEKKPDILVVLLGSNDRQVMRIDGTVEKVRSEKWDAEYKKRVKAFVDAVAEKRTPLVWVGSPPFKFRSMSADILAFNEIYRSATDAVEGTFVDVWDGFVDANGQFSTTGSDIKGQIVRLRAADGINFTRAGREKLAFYVERQLKRILGDEASPLLTSLAPQSLPIMKLPPLQTESNLTRTNPFPVTDPDLDGGSVLLGDVSEVSAKPVSNPLQAKSVRQKLIEDGAPPPTHAGRADDFTWPSTPDTEPTASVVQ